MWWWLRGCVHMSELHQIIYFKYMRFIVYQVDLSKVKKKAWTKKWTTCIFIYQLEWHCYHVKSETDLSPFKCCHSWQVTVVFAAFRFHLRCSHISKWFRQAPWGLKGGGDHIRSEVQASVKPDLSLAGRVGSVRGWESCGRCRRGGEAAALGLPGSRVVPRCPTSVGESTCSHLLLKKLRLQTLNISCSLRPRSHLSLHPHGHFAVFIRQWPVWHPGLRCTGELSQAEGHVALVSVYPRHLCMVSSGILLPSDLALALVAHFPWSPGSWLIHRLWDVWKVLKSWTALTL